MGPGPLDVCRKEGRKGEREKAGEGRMSGIENQQISVEGSYREGHAHSPIILCEVVQLAHSFPHLAIQVQHSGCKVRGKGGEREI